MTVTYLIDKQQCLATLIDAKWNKPCCRSAHEAAKLLGYIRHSALLILLASFLSTRLQHWLSTLPMKEPQDKVKKRWWKMTFRYISKHAWQDIQLFFGALLDPWHAHMWSCYIGYLITCKTTEYLYISATIYGFVGFLPSTCLVWW